MPRIYTVSEQLTFIGFRSKKIKHGRAKVTTLVDS